MATGGPVEVDGRCLALAGVATVRPVSVCVQRLSQVIPDVPRQMLSRVIKRRKQSFGCLTDLKPATIDGDKRG